MSAAALAIRLNAPPPAAPQGHNRPPGEPFLCRECGDDDEAHAAHGAFCSTVCRNRWNNRRLQRGAVIYDLIMTLRYERGVGKALKVWTLICRLAADFRREDHDARAGRKSWREARTVIGERPYLRARVMKPKGRG